MAVRIFGSREGVLLSQEGTRVRPSRRELDADETRYVEAMKAGRDPSKAKESPGEIRPRKTFKGHPFTDPDGRYERLLWIRKHRRAGHTYQEIADALGICRERTRQLAMVSERLHRVTEVVLVGKFPNIREMERKVWKIK